MLPVCAFVGNGLTAGRSKKIQISPLFFYKGKEDCDKKFVIEHNIDFLVYLNRFKIISHIFEK